MADFESELADLMRAPSSAPATRPQELVEAVMQRVEADSRRRAWLVGAFATAGVAVTAAIGAKVASLGVSAVALKIPKIELPVAIDPSHYAMLAALVVMAGASILTIRISRAL